MKIIHLYGTVMCALLTGCILQYGNMMVLGSIVLSFICAGFVVFKLQVGPYCPYNSSKQLHNILYFIECCCGCSISHKVFIAVHCIGSLCVDSHTPDELFYKGLLLLSVVITRMKLIWVDRNVWVLMLINILSTL